MSLTGSSAEGGGPPGLDQMKQGVRNLRLGFFGTLGLFCIFFCAIQLLYYLYGGLLGFPGVYRADRAWPWLTSGAWLFALALPAFFCWRFLRRQDARNFELLARQWDSWRWFDYGVDMFGTELEYSADQELSFARAAGLDPQDPYARNNLGSVLLSQGRIAEAIGFYQEAIRNNPDYYKAYSNLGAAYARQGDSERAVGLYRKALKLNPRDPYSHLNLGIALARLGKNTRAAEHLRQFLVLAPEHPRAREISDFLSGLGLRSGLSS